MGRTIFVLHSAISPDGIAAALRQSTDEERWKLLSLSGYQGNRPLLVKFGENSFRVRKRRYNRNDFSGQFYARYAPEPGGTRIEGYFDVQRWARYFMRIWLSFAVLMGTPFFVGTVLDMTTGRYQTSADKWLGLLVPPTLVLFGTFGPILGRLFGEADRRFILEQIQYILAASIEGPESRVNTLLGPR
jgi:hypothetical protein